MNKISVDQEHKYFHPDAIWCTVYFNDVKQIACITADSEEGWIERYKPVGDNLNKLMLNDDQLVREILHGHVRIEQREPTPGWKAPNGDF